MLIFDPQDAFQAANLPCLPRRLKCRVGSASHFPVLIPHARFRRARIRRGEGWSGERIADSRNGAMTIWCQRSIIKG